MDNNNVKRFTLSGLKLIAVDLETQEVLQPHQFDVVNIQGLFYEIKANGDELGF